MRDTKRDVTLHGMWFHALVGILPAERNVAQRVEIDLTVRVIDSGQILDYRALYDIVNGVFAEAPIDYLEEICDRVAARVLSNDPRVAWARVAVRKPNVTLPGPLDYSEVVVKQRRPRDIAYVALGSNLGDRAAYLARGRAAIAGLPQTRIIAESQIEETPPIGPVDQPPFLNQMVSLRTALTPRELLERLLAIETAEGRTRDVHWGPRTLDLDIVSFDRQTAKDDSLVVPHPELPNREFWQRELAQLQEARRKR